ALQLQHDPDIRQYLPSLGYAKSPALRQLAAEAARERHSVGRSRGHAAWIRRCIVAPHAAEKSRALPRILRNPQWIVIADAVGTRYRVARVGIVRKPRRLMEIIQLQSLYRVAGDRLVELQRDELVAAVETRRQRPGRGVGEAFLAE